MLLVLLLAGLAGLASALACDEHVLNNILVNEGVKSFLEYLNACEFVGSRYDVFAKICEKGFPYEALAGVLEKPGDPDALQDATKAVNLYGRADLLAALVERGGCVLANCHYVLGGNGAVDDRMDLIKLYCDLETSYYFRGFYFTSCGTGKISTPPDSINQSELEILYFMIGQGFDVTGGLSLIFNYLDLSPGDCLISKFNEEFAHVLIERSESVQNFDAMLSCAVRCQNGALIGRLLEFPGLSRYLQLAKHVAGAFLRTNGELMQHIEAWVSREKFCCKSMPEMEGEKLDQFREQFIASAREARQEHVLLEPLRMQDLQLIVTPQSDVFKRVFVFLLGLGYPVVYM